MAKSVEAQTGVSVMIERPPEEVFVAMTNLKHELCAQGKQKLLEPIEDDCPELWPLSLLLMPLRHDLFHA